MKPALLSEQSGRWEMVADSEGAMSNMKGRRRRRERKDHKGSKLVATH